MLSTLAFVRHQCLSLALTPGDVMRAAARDLSDPDTASTRLWERLGHPSVQRPSGPLIWFHAQSAGESAVALPVLFRCLLEYNESVHILLTTSTAEARAMLSSSLPPRVVVQYAPLDNLLCVHKFLRAWRPQAGIFLESPTLPVLLEAAGAAGVKLALLNARVASATFLRWFTGRLSRLLLRRVVGRFTLVVPQSDTDVGRFRMLGATLQQMPGWCSDLKYAAALGTGVWHVWRPGVERVAALKKAVAGRPLWLAANTHAGEEAAAADVHAALSKEWPGLLTAIAPRCSGRAGELRDMLLDRGLRVALWSDVRGDGNGAGGGSGWAPGLSLSAVDVVLVDVLADLPLLYSAAEIAFVGNSLMEGGSGHNLAEAAVAGCAVLVGEHAGHFGQMANELNQAAVLAAEEAAAAVSSSGPLMEEGAMYEGGGEEGGDGGGSGGDPRAGAGGGGGRSDSPLSREARQAAPAHWRGLLDEQQVYAGLQGQGRPSTAPAALAYSYERWTPFSRSDAAATPVAGGAGVSVSGDEGGGRYAHALHAPAPLPRRRHRRLHHTHDAAASGPGSPGSGAVPSAAAHMLSTLDGGGGAGSSGGGGGYSHRPGRAPAGPPPSAATNTPDLLRGGVTPASAVATPAESLCGDEPATSGFNAPLHQHSGSSGGGGARGGGGAGRSTGPRPRPRHNQHQPAASAGGGQHAASCALQRLQRRSSLGRSGSASDGGGGGASSTGAGAACSACGGGGGGSSGGGGVCYSCRSIMPATPTTPLPTPETSCRLLPHAPLRPPPAGAPPLLGRPPHTQQPPQQQQPLQQQSLFWPAAPGSLVGFDDCEDEWGSADGGSLASLAARSDTSSVPLGTPCAPTGPCEHGRCPAGTRAPAAAGGAGACDGCSACCARSSGGGGYGLARPGSPLPPESCGSSPHSSGSPAAAAARRSAPGDGDGGGRNRGAGGGGGGRPVARRLSAPPDGGDGGSSGGSGSSGGGTGDGEGGARSGASLGRSLTMMQLVRSRNCSGDGSSSGGGSGRAGARSAGAEPPAPWPRDATTAAAAPPAQVELYPGPPSQQLLQGLPQRTGSVGWEDWPAVGGGGGGEGGGSDGAAYTQAWVAVPPAPVAWQGVHPLTPPQASAPVPAAPSSASSGSSAPQEGACTTAADGSAPAPAAGTAAPVAPLLGPQRNGTPAAAPRARICDGSGGGGGLEPCRLGDPGRATHFLDPQLLASARPPAGGAAAAATAAVAGDDRALAAGAGGRAQLDGATVAPAAVAAAAESKAPYCCACYGAQGCCGAAVPGAAGDSWAGLDSAEPSSIDLFGGGGGTPSSVMSDITGFSPTSSMGAQSTTPSWATAAAGADAAAPGRPPWRGAPASFTPRLPRHDECASASVSASASAASATGASGADPPGAGPGMSYLRYRGEYILPATHLPYAPHGPAVWRVAGPEGLKLAVSTLLREPLERRSRGHAAAQAAAKLASGLVSTVWHVLDDMVVSPALMDYAAAAGAAAAVATAAAAAGGGAAGGAARG